MRDRTDHRQEEIEAIVRNRFKESVVCGVEELEEYVYSKIGDKLTEEDFETIEGSSRLRWQNDLDWVKARMTRRRQTRHLRINGERCLLWLDVVGELNDYGRIIPLQSIFDVINKYEEKNDE